MSFIAGYNAADPCEYSFGQGRADVYGYVVNPVVIVCGHNLGDPDPGIAERYEHRGHTVTPKRRCHRDLEVSGVPRPHRAGIPSINRVLRWCYGHFLISVIAWAKGRLDRYP